MVAPGAWKAHHSGVNRALLAMIVLAAATTPAAGQSTDLSVMVRDEAGRPLADVEVAIPAAAKRATTDSGGRARFTGVPRGAYAFRARRVGYEPGLVRAPVDDDAPVLVIVLKARIVSLDTIKVLENCPWRGFGGFECRQRLGKGLFLDYVAIDSSRVDDVGKLFYDRPGWRVVRQARTGIPQPVSLEGWRCLVTIVDGMPISLQNPAPVYADELLGVEAYADGKSVPKDYEKYSWKGKYHCGLINYWTVRGNGR